MTEIYEDKLRKLVNSSGFPLQIGLQNELEKSKESHAWRVLTKEHPWRCAESGNNGFIDIVLTDVHNTQRMVIECKRVRDTEWVFLDPSISVNDRRHTRFWMSYIENYKTKVFDWHDGVVDPSSPETEFCVVHGQDKNSKPMLERIASELVDATESFAKEEFKLYDNC